MGKLIPGFYWLRWWGEWTVGHYDGDNSVEIVGESGSFGTDEFVWGPRIEENLAQKEEQRGKSQDQAG